LENEWLTNPPLSVVPSSKSQLYVNSSFWGSVLLAENAMVTFGSA
jgi:hypothetical protein